MPVYTEEKITCICCEGTIQMLKPKQMSESESYWNIPIFTLKSLLVWKNKKEKRKRQEKKKEASLSHVLIANREVYEDWRGNSEGSTSPFIIA